MPLAYLKAWQDFRNSEGGGRKWVASHSVLIGLYLKGDRLCEFRDSMLFDLAFIRCSRRIWPSWKRAKLIMRIFTIRLNQKGGSDASISDWAGSGFFGFLAGLD
jgi:hypothetical protein